MKRAGRVSGLGFVLAAAAASAAGGTPKIYPLPRATPPVDPRPERRDLPPMEPAFYLSVSGFTDLVVTDAAGNAHPVLPSEADLKAIARLDPARAQAKLAAIWQGPPGVTISRDADDAATLVLSRFVRHKITFKGTGRGTSLAVYYGFGSEESAVLTMRYLDTDLPLATGDVAAMELSPKGITPIAVSGPGGRRRVVAPTAVLSGAGRQDSESPRVTIKQARVAGGLLVTVLASDRQSGVRAIYFSTDGRAFRPYTGPVMLSDRGIRRVRAFAEDKAGNRSASAPASLEW